MLLINDVILWLLLAFHVVGGATVFRRLFPAESPWLAFFVPALGLVVVLNFIEHLVGIPSLLWLLPFTLGGLFWSIASPGYSWSELRLPAAVFLVAFAFNFALKTLHPDIPTDDSMGDLKRVLDFSFGDRLPPIDSFLPPYDYRWYYTLEHYGASIVERLFDLDLGTACNLSFTLTNTLVCVAGAGIAYLASGRRAWVAFAMMPILEAGFTGSMPWLILTMKQPDFGYAVDLDGGWRNHDPGAIFKLLANEPHQALVLEPPGDWVWYGQFHANIAGFLLMFLAAFCALLVLDPRRCNWPWACLVLIVPLSMLAAAWYLPLCAALGATALLLALALGRRPENMRLALAFAAGGLALLWPALTHFANTPDHQPLHWTAPDDRTPFWIFVIQWWPVWLPWLVLLFFWRRMTAGGRWLHASVALLFLLTEFFTVGDWRWYTVEKMWGGVFGLGIVGLVAPLLASRRIVARLVTVLIVLATLATLSVRLERSHQWVDWNQGFLNLSGDTYLRNDAQKSRMLQALRQLHDKVVLAGMCFWNYSPPPGLVVFSMNRCYVAWFATEQLAGHGGEAEYRTALNNQFYAGQMPDPLSFLNQNGIDGVLIAPEDKIADAILSKLRGELAPSFEYVDCKAGGADNAGVFLRRPLPVSARG